MENRISCRVRIPNEVLFRNLNDESVILDLASENYFALNEVGTRTWELMEEHGDLQAVLDVLVSVYEVAESELREDVLTLIGQLEEAGLLVVEESPRDG